MDPLWLLCVVTSAFLQSALRKLPLLAGTLLEWIRAAYCAVCEEAMTGPLPTFDHAPVVLGC